MTESTEPQQPTVAARPACDGMFRSMRETCPPCMDLSCSQWMTPARAAVIRELSERP